MWQNIYAWNVLKQYNKMTGETISQKIEANILSIVMGMP